MILPLLGLSLGTLAIIMAAGSKKKKTPLAVAEDESTTTVAIEEGDPDLAATADEMPNTVPLKLPDGEVVPVPAPTVDDLADDDDDAEEVLPSEEEQEEQSEEAVEPGDPDLQAAVTPSDAAIKLPTGEVTTIPVEEIAEEDDEDDDEEEEDQEEVQITPTELDEAEAIPGQEAVVQTPDGGIVVSPIESDDNEPEDMASRDLAQLLLDAEHQSNWKTLHQAEVAAWQQTHGLKADGKFGPKSALVLAMDVGVAPIVRYWPSGTWPGSPAMEEYLDNLTGAGIDNSREKGQGFGSNKITSFAELG
jgi:hypothetical protein